MKDSIFRVRRLRRLRSAHWLSFAAAIWTLLAASTVHAYISTSWIGSGTGGITTTDPSDPRTNFNVSSNWSGGVPNNPNYSATFQFTGAGAAYLSQNNPYIHLLTVSGTTTLPTVYFQADLQTDTLATSNGNINQSAGTVNVTTLFGMADPGTTDTYALSGGTLFTDSSAFVTIGDSGAATFTHSGGTFDCEGNVEIGKFPGSLGIYHLSGTANLINGNLGLGYSGNGTFDQSGGTASVQGTLRLGAGISGLSAPRATLNLSGGSLTTDTLQAGGQIDTVTMNLTNAAANFRVQSLFTLGSNVDLHAVSGFRVRMSNAAFDNFSTSAHRQADLSHLIMEFDGGTSITGNFEVGGVDLGAVQSGFVENFSLGGLQLDAGASAGQVKLVDAHDNSPGGGKEALYVDSLILGAGSKLDLNGYNVYYHSASIDTAATIVLGGGHLVAVSEPSTFALAGAGLAAIALARRRRGLPRRS